MDVLGKLISGLAEGFLRGAVRKAVAGFVAKGYITGAQAPEMEAGVMDEIQVALAMWQASQVKPSASAS